MWGGGGRRDEDVPGAGNYVAGNCAAGVCGNLRSRRGDDVTRSQWLSAIPTTHYTYHVYHLSSIAILFLSNLLFSV